jgi:hypothetical protein
LLIVREDQYDVWLFSHQDFLLIGDSAM